MPDAITLDGGNIISPDAEAGLFSQRRVPITDTAEGPAQNCAQGIVIRIDLQAAGAAHAGQQMR